MQPEPAWRRYLRFWGPDAGSDVADELQFHLLEKTDELMASGLTREQARAEALRQFGPVRPIRKECRAISRGRQIQASRIEYFVGWARDLHYAFRALCRSKASTFAGILILAVGIGATTGVFTLLDRLLYRPLPVRQPSQLLLFSTSSPSKDGAGERIRYRSFPYSAYEQLRRESNSFGLQLSGEAIVRVIEKRSRDKVEGPAEARGVSANYFDVLGIQALFGRVLGSSDDAEMESQNVAVASYSFWSRRYGRSPAALGATVYLNDVPFTVVGVLPQGFNGLQQASAVDLYIPIAGLRRVFDLSVFAEERWIQMFGRLRPGVPAATAQLRLQGLVDRLWIARGASPRIEPQDLSGGIRDDLGQRKSSLTIVGVIAVLLLLMGCANLACLLMARAAARQQEIAVRIALGAGRARVVRQSLMESLLLALAGGSAGLGVAFWADRLLLVAFQWQRRPIDLSPDWRVLTFALAVSLATGFLFGLAPASQVLRGGRAALVPERTVARRFSPGKALVVVEVGLSLVLVAGAAVFLRSFQNLRSVPTGFSTDHISVVTLESTADQHAPFHEAVDLAASLRGAPGVEAAGISDLLTFNDGWIGYGVTVPGAPRESERQVHLLKVDGGYFGALRVAVIAGRPFTARDDENAPKVGILSEGTARRLFPGETAIGKRILLGRFRNPKPEDETEIVGVVNDIKFGSVTAPGPDLVLQPLLQGQHNTASTAGLRLHVRSRMSPRDLVAVARSRIAELGLRASVVSAAPLDDAVSASMLDHRIRMQASGLFGVLALLLLTAGMNGLMSYLVVLRRRELGIRVAVGSRPSGIVGLVLRDGLGLVLAGVVIGMPGALAVMKAVSHLVFGLPAFDWASVVLAAAILFATAVLASAVPAWRAARLDPVEVLRQ